MKLIDWKNAPLSDRLAVYDAYCATFDGFGFFDAPDSFEDFDQMLSGCTFKYVRALYMGA